MKFFQKKSQPSSGSRKPTASESVPEQSFYSRHVEDAPLDDYFDGTVPGAARRTSRHSPARRRETSNRASDWALFILLFRAGLIVVLLAAGFFGLRWFLNRMAEPTEKEQKRWEAKAVLMEKSTTVAGAKVLPVAQELVISPELIKQRLERWGQAERSLRSAEALVRRGIDEEAIQRLSQALKVSPENQAAQQMLVDVYMKRGLYAEAVPLCVRLLDQNSGRQDLQMTLLKALQSSGQTDSGLVLADRILLDQPRNLTVLSIAAAGQNVLGNADAALALFMRMLEVDGKNKDALEGCGGIYLKRGDYPQATVYYLELVRLDPAEKYYRILALCYAQQSQPGKAVVFMGQAASLFGDKTVSPWLKETVFDPIRESVEFRSFADRIVGAETRKAIEDINKREAEKKAVLPGGGLELPTQPDLKVINPSK
jgi:tetratricopeptide (TPR) repeat protein